MYYSKLIKNPLFFSSICTFCLCLIIFPGIITFSIYSTLALSLIYFFIFISGIFMNYYIFTKLSINKSPLKSITYYLIIFILIIILVGFILNFFHGQNLKYYIYIGDYLRDSYGINWYFKDYTGWIFSQIILTSQIIVFILFWIKSMLAEN